MIREPKKAAPTRHTNNNNIHSDNNDNAQEVRGAAGYPEISVKHLNILKANIEYQNTTICICLLSLYTCFL